MALEITESNFEELAMNTDKPVLLDFWAEWCGPCREIAPYIDEVAEKFGDKAVVGKVEIEGNPAIPGRFRIRNIPTVLILKNGVIVEKMVGKNSKSDYFAALEKHL